MNLGGEHREGGSRAVSAVLDVREEMHFERVPFLEGLSALENERD